MYVYHDNCTTYENDLSERVFFEIKRAFRATSMVLLSCCCVASYFKPILLNPPKHARAYKSDRLKKKNSKTSTNRLKPLYKFRNNSMTPFNVARYVYNGRRKIEL